MITGTIVEMDGSNKSTIDLPMVFSTPYLPKLIQKVFKNRADILLLDRWLVQSHEIQDWE